MAKLSFFGKIKSAFKKATEKIKETATKVKKKIKDKLKKEPKTNWEPEPPTPKDELVLYRVMEMIDNAENYGNAVEKGNARRLRGVLRQEISIYGETHVAESLNEMPDVVLADAEIAIYESDQEKIRIATMEIISIIEEYLPSAQEIVEDDDEYEYEQDE